MTSIPPKIRRILYWVGSGIAILLGCVAAWTAASGYAQPPWMIGIVSVLAFLGAALNGLAGSNVQTSTPAEPAQPGLGG